MWIECDWMSLNPKQVNFFLKFFQILSNLWITGLTEQVLMLHRCRSRVDTLDNDSANMGKAHQECNAQGGKKSDGVIFFSFQQYICPRLALALSAILLV
jgi:hypothetical protein